MAQDLSHEGRWLLGWVASHPPPGPFRPRTWRSPLRGPWLTAVLGMVLLAGLPVVFLTGLASYAAYEPGLPGNDRTPGSGLLGGYLGGWPTAPSELYRITQGTHVLLGVVLVPVVLAKLWSVIPRLFAWPPVSSPAQAVERLSLLLLVGGIGFELATGVANIQYWYVFPGSFYRLHLYGAWVFIAALAAHVVVKLPTAVASLRSRSWREELRTDTAHTVPEPLDVDGLVSRAPSAATISRRGALAVVGVGSLSLLLLSVGQVVGGPLRRLALLAPRGQQTGSGPGSFQVNKRAAEVGVGAAQTGDSWRLVLHGPGPQVSLTRADLLALPQHTVGLPIACVEGWSSGVQQWTGVRLRDLAALAGQGEGALMRAGSLQRSGSFRAASFSTRQVADGDSLLALKVNGADLSLDHGYPARVIVPAAPGVHCTKWVTALSFAADAAALGRV